MSGDLRLVLVGEVRVAEYVLRGILAAGHRPVCLVTTDTARAQQLSGMAPGYYADLPRLGRELGVPVRVVSDLGVEREAIAALSPDYVFVVGWPRLVREDVLSIAPCIGLHPTRLPSRRGGAPLNWMILDGEPAGAVSLIRLRAGVDDGEILAQQEFPIAGTDYVGDVMERACCVAERLVAASVRALAAGSATWTPQDPAAATYTRRRRPEDGRICWRDSSTRIRNLIRATSHPFPGAFTRLNGETIRIWRADVPAGYRAPLAAEPGRLLGAGAGGVLVSTMDNALLVTHADIGGCAVSGRALGERLAARTGETFE